MDNFLDKNNHNNRGEPKPPPKKTFNFKSCKKNTINSINDVEHFLNNFHHYFKYFKLYKIMRK